MENTLGIMRDQESATEDIHFLQVIVKKSGHAFPYLNGSGFGTLLSVGKAKPIECAIELNFGLEDRSA